MSRCMIKKFLYHIWPVSKAQYSQGMQEIRAVLQKQDRGLVLAFQEVQRQDAVENENKRELCHTTKEIQDALSKIQAAYSPIGLNPEFIALTEKINSICFAMFKKEHTIGPNFEKVIIDLSH